MFIETSNPRKPGDNAFLESEEFQPTGGNGRCLKFWFHMKGSGIGTLNVWITENKTKGMLWSVTTPKTNNWEYATAPIKTSQVYVVRLNE